MTISLWIRQRSKPVAGRKGRAISNHTTIIAIVYVAIQITMVVATVAFLHQNAYHKTALNYVRPGALVRGFPSWLLRLPSRLVKFPSWLVRLPYRAMGFGVEGTEQVEQGGGSYSGELSAQGEAFGKGGGRSKKGRKGGRARNGDGSKPIVTIVL